MRFDGSLYGRFARFGEIGDFDRDFLDRRVFVACGMAVDGVPCKSYAGSNFYILSYFLVVDDGHGVCCNTNIVKENVTQAGV